MNRMFAAIVVAIGLASPATAQNPPGQRPAAPVAQPPRPTVPQAPGQAPAGPQLPARVTGQMLTAVCNENRPACMTYVLGTIDAVVATRFIASGRSPFCFPPGTTNQVITDAAIRYLLAHPEQRGLNAAVIVTNGLAAVYPCRR